MTWRSVNISLRLFLGRVVIRPPVEAQGGEWVDLAAAQVAVYLWQ